MSVTINAVHAVRATHENGVFWVDHNFTIEGSQYADPVPMDGTYGSRPEDEAEHNMAIRQWLADNPDFPITPYVPPTLEEQRESSFPIPRIDFRNQAKAIGITTTVITNYLAGIEDPDHQEDMQIFWEDSQQFRRLDPFVIELGAFAGKPPEQLDPIWGIGV